MALPFKNVLFADRLIRYEVSTKTWWCKHSHSTLYLQSMTIWSYLSIVINKAIETELFRTIRRQRDWSVLDSLYNLINYHNIKTQPIIMVMYFFVLLLLLVISSYSNLYSYLFWGSRIQSHRYINSMTKWPTCEESQPFICIYYSGSEWMALCFQSHIRLCGTVSRRMSNTMSSNVIINKDAETSGVNVYSHGRMCLICSLVRGAQHAITMTHTHT